MMDVARAKTGNEILRLPSDAADDDQRAVVRTSLFQSLESVEEDAKVLLKQVTTEVTPATAFVAPFNSVMVVHTGLGLVGLAWWWET